MIGNKIIFASGCYTEKMDHTPFSCGEGIVLLDFDDVHGSLTTLTTMRGLKNPSYLDWVQESQSLYVVTESSGGDGEIREFILNTDGTLVPGSVRTGPGRAGCHLKVLPDKNRIFAASYMDGCLKKYLLNQKESASSSVHFYKGRGPVSGRQDSSHAHQVLPGPGHHFLYICDLGSDRVWIHSLEHEGHPLVGSLSVPAGYGPRHLAFDTSGQYVFILCELNPRLLVARVNPEDGSLSIEQDLPTVSFDATERTAPAAVKIHPSGNTIAVSNRFDDTIRLFRIIRNDADDKLHLEESETFSCRGKTPRDICFSPSGRWLLVANQDSSDVQIRSFDPETGKPGNVWGAPLTLGTPVCLVPLE